MKNDIKKTDGKKLLEEVKAAAKPQKQPKTYTTWQIIKVVTKYVIILAIGAYVGITANNAIESYIDGRVSSEVSQLKASQ